MPLSYDMVASLSVFFISLCISPGPNNVLLLRSGICFGLAKTLPHIAGGIVGAVVLFVVSFLGLSPLLKINWIAIPLKLLSIAYLLYLAWRIAQQQGLTAVSTAQQARPLSCLQSFMLVFINPSVWMMIMGVLMTYLPSASSTRQPAAFATILAIFLIIGSTCSFIWTLGGKLLHPLLAKPHYLQRINQCTAVLLACSIIPMLGDLIDI